jgi:hypothetical protein
VCLISHPLKVVDNPTAQIPTGKTKLVYSAMLGGHFS